jgi:hypothetical protein
MASGKIISFEWASSLPGRDAPEKADHRPHVLAAVGDFPASPCMGGRLPRSVGSRSPWASVPSRSALAQALLSGEMVAKLAWAGMPGRIR